MGLWGEASPSPCTYTGFLQTEDWLEAPCEEYHFWAVYPVCQVTLGSSLPLSLSFLTYKMDVVRLHITDFAYNGLIEPTSPAPMTCLDEV